MDVDLAQNLEDEEDDDDDEEEEESEIVSERVHPAERSGHIAVIDRNCIYIWGGYKSSEAALFSDLYLSRIEIWVFNLETQRWCMRRSQGEVPGAMSGSCGACIDGVLYLFGGHHARGNSNLVYRLPLRAPELVWEHMKNLTGRAPSCKDKLGCWIYNHRLVYFGGYGFIPEPGHRGSFELDENSVMGHHAGRGWNNHIHILDLESNTWTQPITQGVPPSPRAAHACATIANTGFVFGGRYRDHRLNDLHCINLDSWQWSQMYGLIESVCECVADSDLTHQCGTGLGPVGRSWHSLTPVSADQLFLFGGFTTSRETLSDGWIYSISGKIWKPFKHQHMEQPRLWHTACFTADGEVCVFGGCANNLLSHEQAAHSNELLIFTLQPKPLFRLCMDIVVLHRKSLEKLWNILPKALLVLIQNRSTHES
ncbi:hypothetical protein DNTS_030481 [Danionella cerebrum]|uniref:Kelch domain-containing protein 2 n=1 Tax=Danionella cerebrum TaxID=2873325 RepID=A0A553MM28_9TELE|nr:hypothetical protein DNTS_030481 [Danionella translucida]